MSGICDLFSGECTPDVNFNWDFYTTSTKIYPDLTVPEKCVHLQAYSVEIQDSDIRTACSNI